VSINSLNDMLMGATLMKYRHPKSETPSKPVRCVVSVVGGERGSVAARLITNFNLQTSTLPSFVSYASLHILLITTSQLYRIHTSTPLIKGMHAIRV